MRDLHHWSLSKVISVYLQYDDYRKSPRTFLIFSIILPYYFNDNKLSVASRASQCHGVSAISVLILLRRRLTEITAEILHALLLLKQHFMKTKYIIMKV